MLPERRVVYVYIETPVDEALKRIEQRARKGEEALDKEYLTKIQEAHESWLRTETDVVRIDGTQSPDVVATQIQAVIRGILGS